MHTFVKKIYCKCLEHRSEIYSLFHFIIDVCVISGLNCIIFVWSSGRDMPGWTEQVKPERDRSLFWLLVYGVNLVSLQVVLFMTS